MRFTVGNLVRILMMFVAFATFSVVATAQERSEDRDKPTAVTTNEIVDDLDGDDDEYFYILTVGPGKLTITIDVKAEGTNAGATIDLFDTKSKPILSNVLIQGIDRGSDRVVKTLTSAKQRDIILRVKGIKYGSSGGNGTYKIKFDGPLVLKPAEVPPAPIVPPAPVEKP